MSEQVKIDEKTQKPGTHFNEPRDVAADSSLSGPQKAKALDTLEQDARQLSAASDEGMAGGERSKLQEVLKAKDALAQPPKPMSKER